MRAAKTERRCRLLGTDVKGTILEWWTNGWVTVLWDGAPTCCDVLACRIEVVS